MDTAVKVPLSERINFRLVAFIGVIALMVGYPVYVMVDQQVSGGIKNAGDGYKEVNLKAMSTYTFDELAAAAGVTTDELREVERFGLVIGRLVGADTIYDENAVVAARTAGAFLRYGIEPRHLRLYRNAADREAGLIEQVIMPWVKQRNPQARAQARTSLDDLARLGAELREAILRQSLRPYIEG